MIVNYLERQLEREAKYGDRMQWCKCMIVKYKGKLEELL